MSERARRRERPKKRKKNLIKENSSQLHRVPGGYVAALDDPNAGSIPIWTHFSDVFFHFFFLNSFSFLNRSLFGPRPISS